MSKKPPVWKIKPSDLSDPEITVHVLNNKIVIEQDPDMLLVTVEEAKELVSVLKSAIDYAEEN